MVYSAFIHYSPDSAFFFHRRRIPTPHQGHGGRGRRRRRRRRGRGRRRRLTEREAVKRRGQEEEEEGRQRFPATEVGGQGWRPAATLVLGEGGVTVTAAALELGQGEAGSEFHKRRWWGRKKGRREGTAAFRIASMPTAMAWRSWRQHRSTTVEERKAAMTKVKERKQGDGVAGGEGERRGRRWQGRKQRRRRGHVAKTEEEMGPRQGGSGNGNGGRGKRERTPEEEKRMKSAVEINDCGGDGSGARRRRRRCKGEGSCGWLQRRRTKPKGFWEIAVKERSAAAVATEPDKGGVETTATEDVDGGGRNGSDDSFPCSESGKKRRREKMVSDG